MSSILRFGFERGDQVTITVDAETLTEDYWGDVPPPPPPPPDETADPGLVRNANETASLVMAPDDDPKTILWNSESLSVDPALVADGPVPLNAPVISRVGTSRMTVAKYAVWVNDEAAGGLDPWGSGWYKNGNRFYSDKPSYVKDGEKLTDIISYCEVMTDDNGTRMICSNPLSFG